MQIARWDLASSLGNERLKKLTAPSEFEAIVEEIKKRMEVLCCHLEKCESMAGFKRVTYCIKVPRTLFDLFFNSRNGYRAWYYSSPYDGLRANDYFIQSLLPALVVSEHSEQAISTKGRQFIEESLTSPSAKAWLVEYGRGKCSLCNEDNGEWTAPQDEAAEIENDRWERCDHSHARWGRKTPYLTKIRVFGAFLNDQYDEFVPALKRHRAKQIHEHGWS